MSEPICPWDDADRAAALRHLRWAVAELPLAADQWWQSAAQEAFRAQLNRLRLGLNAIETDWEMGR